MYILQQKYVILEYSQQFVCLNRASLLLKIALDSDALMSLGIEFHNTPPLSLSSTTHLLNTPPLSPLSSCSLNFFQASLS